MTDNRTTELREMLTERGVEWTKPKSATEFIQTTFLRNGWGIEVLERNIGLCVTATNIFDTPEQAIAATLGGNREAELQAALNKAAGNWAKSQERVRELERMLLIDNATVEDYTERADLLVALEREKDKANEFHADWKKMRSDYEWLEGENAKWQAYCEELERKLEAVTLGNGTLTAEQVSKATYAHSIHADCADADWQAIADELNAELGSGTCELTETDSYSNANNVVHVLECSACGETCEHVNGSYPRCPNCGRKVVSA